MNKNNLIDLINAVNELDIVLSSTVQRKRIDKIKHILNKEITNHNKSLKKITKGDYEWLKQIEKDANKEWDYEYGTL